MNLYFNPKKNVHYERYKLLQLKQEDGETIDNFVTRLKVHAKSCDYNNYNEDEAVTDKFILSCTDPTIRKTLLKEAATKKHTIENALLIGRTIQITTKNAQEIENKDSHNLVEGINKIKITNTSPSKFYQGPLQNSYQNPPSQNHFSHSIQCSNCGYNHSRNCCPAFGKSCSFCNTMNHFSSVCKSHLKQQNNTVHANQISDLIPKSILNLIQT